MQNNLHCWITMPFTVCQVSILGRQHINNVVVPALTALSPGDLKERPTCVPPAVATSKLNHGEVFGCGSFMSGHNRSQSRKTREVVPESRIKSRWLRERANKTSFLSRSDTQPGSDGPKPQLHCHVQPHLSLLVVALLRRHGSSGGLSLPSVWAERDKQLGRVLAVSVRGCWSDENNLTSAHVLAVICF